ncbi:MAG: tetratricopeptide repeat protein [Candidatus Omnitrophica bacterium]|nr:tetratricopeptide repeat protein [Candidatus Omnitrophota bacterium]
MNNIEEKIKNLEEWNSERARIKPILEIAVDYHNKARREKYWKNFEKASEFYIQAIENYRSTLKLNPRYYLQDIVERVDSVIEEYVNNTFDIKISGERLKTEQGVREFIEFIEGLNCEEKKYIDQYEIALSYFKIADIYFGDGNFDKAYEFFNKVADMACNRPFLNRATYFKIGQILFYKKRFKEALVSFVSMLSFDRGNADAVCYIDKCLKELKIFEHRFRFLSATPNEAKKLIMGVL